MSSSTARRPIIGITASMGAARAGKREVLNCAYAAALAQCGATPIIIPSTGGADDAGALLELLDGLMLSGGVDLDPKMYGEPVLNSTVTVHPVRDKAEARLIPAALSTNIPILGICRGIQALNVAMGGSLYQDLPDQRPSAIAHSQTESRHSATHTIRVAPNSRLHCIVDCAVLNVNSHHHQAINRVAGGLTVTAYAEDGVVEAVEMDGKRFVVAVQYHPEELVGRYIHARLLFEAFVDACRAESEG